MSARIVYTLTVSVSVPLDLDYGDGSDRETLNHVALDVIRAIERGRVSGYDVSADAEVLEHTIVDVVTHYTGSAHPRAQHDRVTLIASKVDCPQCFDQLQRADLLKGGQS